MMEKRTPLTADEQLKTIKVLHEFKDIHAQIKKLEDKMKSIGEEKDLLLTLLETKRGDDVMLHADLELKYGEGKIDLTTFEWVNGKQEMNA